MTTLNIYQVMLGNAKYHEINTKGWGGTSWDSFYTWLTSFPKEDKVALFTNIKGACENGLYKHSYIVDSNVSAEDSLDRAFAVTNGMSSTGVNVERMEPCKSGSVGDIAVDNDTHRGWICMPCGWLELDQEVVFLLEHLVTTRVRISKPI